jgi:hypothetical protein
VVVWQSERGLTGEDVHDSGGFLHATVIEHCIEGAAPTSVAMFAQGLKLPRSETAKSCMNTLSLFDLSQLDLSRLISSHTMLFHLPVKHYSLSLN